MEIEEGDLVICTVERIEKTVVFVKAHLGKEDIDGSIITSEIAPGRIRNIRDYVVPKKRIVCKVLRISKTGNVELSFRRVSLKERKEVLEREKQERSYISVFKSILGENSEKAIGEMSKESGLVDFVERAREDPKILSRYMGEKDSEKIIEILKKQKEKKAVLKREILLKSMAPDGLAALKEVLGKVKNAEVRYISAGKYSIKAESGNIKESDRIIKDAEEEIGKVSKGFHLEFSILEK